MAGIVEKADISAIQGSKEALDCCLDFEAVLIRCRDDFEAGTAKNLRDLGSVVGRVLEFRKTGIVGISQYERHTALRRQTDDGRYKKCQSGQESYDR
jgi:hypothetical protein